MGCSSKAIPITLRLTSWPRMAGTGMYSRLPNEALPDKLFDCPGLGENSFSAAT